MIASKNWLVFLFPVANRSFVLSVSTIWKIKPTLISLGQPKDNKKYYCSNEMTPLKERRKKSKYEIKPKRTLQIGLNRIPRKQNVSPLRNLQYSFYEELKHLSRGMKFICSTFSRSPFSCNDRALNSQGLKKTLEFGGPLWLVYVNCDSFQHTLVGRNAWRIPKRACRRG